MTDGHRPHAARVAVVATAIVLAAYTACAFGFSVFVNHRLFAQVDARLEAQLAHESMSIRHHGSWSMSRGAGNAADPDDVPVFFWRIRPSGVARPLSSAAPSLPRRTWTTAPVTRTLGSIPFRLAATRVGSGWVVAGENVANVSRVDAAVVLPEIVFGLLLALATFTGAFIVGLRASAPLELIRRRQAAFTADASHELRTPLSVVEAEVALALRRHRTAEEYESVLRRIGAEGRRLRRLVDDLLWLARADNGAAEARTPDGADVEAIAAACVDRFRAVARRRAVSLTFLRSGVLPATVHADPEWVDRLAGVLIDNACKYAGRGGSVTVGVTSSPHRVVLCVDDSGPGIRPAERAAVFDRFHRAVAEEGGSGLGLAIADSVVRMTDGAWSVEDAELGGARMAVAWRRVVPRQKPPPTREPSAGAFDLAAAHATATNS